MGLTDMLNKATAHLAHPAHPDHANPTEHPAHMGATSVRPDTPEALLSRVTTSNQTTQIIQSQGNCGVGMDDGLRAKAIAQQEAVAERSRLRHEGLLQPHVKHETLVNLSTEHREVADGREI